MALSKESQMILNRTDASDAAELQATFDLRWQADQRAIKKWQAAHPGNDLVWPDHADMVVWLLEQLDAPKENAFDYNDTMLEAAIDQAVAKEREQCAKIVETYALDKLNHISSSRVTLAAAIRNKE